MVNSIGMKLVAIPPGKFAMGSPPGETGRDDDEGPQHEVTITEGFHLNVFEVPEWRSVGDDNAHLRVTISSKVARSGSRSASE